MHVDAVPLVYTRGQTCLGAWWEGGVSWAGWSMVFKPGAALEAFAVAQGCAPSIQETAAHTIWVQQMMHCMASAWVGLSAATSALLAVTYWQLCGDMDSALHVVTWTGAWTAGDPCDSHA
jgi:hypothetical protein